ncbi:SMP-30/gluconolactonase/LRE family protein [Vibrio crassostreae]|uniref:SMP-30/gluconolactonase/LRE family protein n=1 Tax=Vibrio crassostreae TaxID=246167 RepID=UPI001B3087E6|nr:SMP-30/gluconolactonase/LRE family protein [Vibrio crassostreae]
MKNRLAAYRKSLLLSALTAGMAVSTFTNASVFPEGAEFKQLYTGGQFTEGVTVSPKGDVYFVDVRPTKEPGDKLGRTLIYHPNTDSTTVLLGVNGQVNGMKFSPNGKLLMTSRANYGTRSLVELDLETNESRLLAARYEGKPFNGLNDLAIAPNGTVFVTDPRYLGYEERGQDFFGVYAIDKSFNISLVTKDVLKPNGIAVSPDGKTLYVAEHYINSDNLLEPTEELSFGPMRVLAYELSENSVLGEPKVVFDYGQEDGPDGMITDSEGNLYVAARADSNFGIHVFNSEGDKIDQIVTPQKPTNVAFGKGENNHKLYITAGGSLYVVDTKKKGWN